MSLLSFLCVESASFSELLDVIAIAGEDMAANPDVFRIRLILLRMATRFALSTMGILSSTPSGRTGVLKLPAGSSWKCPTSPT